MSDEIYSQLPLRPPGLPQNMNFLDSTQRAVDNITFLDMSAQNLALKCSFSFGRNSSLKLAESFNATLSRRSFQEDDEDDEDGKDDESCLVMKVYLLIKV